MCPKAFKNTISGPLQASEVSPCPTPHSVIGCWLPTHSVLPWRILQPETLPTRLYNYQREPILGINKNIERWILILGLLLHAFASAGLQSQGPRVLP